MENKARRTYQHVRSFLKVLDGYDGKIPLSRFLSGFFRANKQMGSSDRKAVSRFAYHYFRLGKSAAGLDPVRRLVLGEFLCADQSPLVAAESEELAAAMNASVPSGIAMAESDATASLLEARIAFLEEKTSFRLADVFPFSGHLSPLIDRVAFTKQLFVQPDLFLRLRSGKEDQVMRMLGAHGVTFNPVDRRTLALPNRTALEHIRGLSGLAEVQDLSSQRTLDGVQIGKGDSWWDVCAGSGGKSLLLLDRQPDVRLLVSDIRDSILKNLDVRFEAAGIRTYRRKIMDLTRDTRPVLGDELFDGLLLDAPCTGSGTWGRTPEMLSFFEGEEALAGYVQLQQSIVRHAVPHLRPGQPLVYITCSVFRDENEDMVENIRREHGMQLVSMDYLKGYEAKADTLFVAILRR